MIRRKIKRSSAILNLLVVNLRSGVKKGIQDRDFSEKFLVDDQESRFEIKDFVRKICDSGSGSRMSTSAHNLPTSGSRRLLRVPNFALSEGPNRYSRCQKHNFTVPIAYYATKELKKYTPVKKLFKIVQIFQLKFFMLTTKYILSEYLTVHNL